MNSSNKPKWDNPQASIGKQVAATRIKTIWEASGPALELFEQRIFHAIEETLNLNKEHLDSEEESSHTISFHLWMVGRKPESAQPTIIFTSKSAALRTKVVKVIKENRVLAEFPGIALKSMNRMPAIPMGYQSNSAFSSSGSAFPRSSTTNEINPFDIDMLQTSRTSRSAISGPSSVRDASPLLVEALASEQVCGTPLLIDGRYEATMGGIVKINDLYFGFTVVHSPLFRVDDFTESIHSGESFVTFDQQSDSTSKASSLHPSSASNSMSAQSLPSEPGPIAPTDSQQGEKHQKEEDDNPRTPGRVLSTLGYTSRINASQSLDYRLFGIDNPLYHVANRISSPDGCHEHSQGLVPQSIAAYSCEREVWLATAKSGILRGFLMKNPYYIKMAGSARYQKMWPVQLDRNIVSGDCGAWAVDAQNGKLYGHVVAGNSSLTRAYIIPAVEVFRDIQCTYGGHVALPQSFEGLSDGELLAKKNYSEAVAAHSQTNNDWSMMRLTRRLRSEPHRRLKRESPVLCRYDTKAEVNDEFFSYANSLDFLRDAHWFGYGQDTGSIIFLDGNLSSDWLSALGSTYVLNPAFFVNHLEIGHFRDSKSTSRLPELPSTSRFTLRYTTVGLLGPTKNALGPRESVARRNTKVHEFAQYLKKVASAKAGRFVESDPSRVRHFSVHSDQTCSLEQDISISLQQSKDSWNVFVWFDGGQALDYDPRPPWAGMTEVPQPTTHNTSWLSSGHDLSARNLNRFGNTGCARLIQPEEYGRGLDRTVATRDPFYALTNLFAFVARSEHHFLEMMQSISDTSPEGYDINESPLVLDNFVYNKTILERHVRQIKECINLVDARGGPDWRRTTDCVHKEAFAAMKSLSADFQFLLGSAQALVDLYHQQIELLHNQAALQGSRRALEQNKWIQSLTAVTVLFLPLSFISSVVGTRVAVVDSGSWDIWQGWVIASAAILGISLLSLFYGLSVSSGIQKLASSLKERVERSTSGDCKEAAAPRPQGFGRQNPRPDFQSQHTTTWTSMRCELQPAGAEELPDKPPLEPSSFASSSLKPNVGILEMDTADLEKNAPQSRH